MYLAAFIPSNIYYVKCI